MSIKELRNEARKAHTVGDLQRAEGLYRKLLKEDGRASDASNLGSLLRAIGRLDEAITLYREWINQFPDNLTLRLNAINSAIEKGDTKQSHEWIREGLNRLPGSWELYKARARTLIREGNYRESIKILETLAKEKPNESGVWMDIALARHHLEEWNDALNALNRVLKINPYDPRPYCNILSIYRTTGQWEKANFMLEKMEHSLKNSLPVMSRSRTCTCSTTIQKGRKAV